MSIKKRKGSPYWWCNFTINGERIRESTGTADRELAEKYEARRKQEIWSQQKLGAKPRRQWTDAVVRWCREKADKRSFEDDLCHLRWLDPYLRNLSLDEIDEDVLDELIDAKIDAGLKPSSVNRMTEMVRGILRRAHLVWKWTDRLPTFRMLGEGDGRVRWLTEDQAAALLRELPAHLQVMAEFTLETGLRSANVKGLRWSEIDMQRRCCWVLPEDAKAGVAIAVPLSARALKLIKQQIGRHLEYVFTYQPRGKKAPEPIKGKLSTQAWHKALARAGIADFRWHDLRHTWASWHVQRGTPMRALMELGGWSGLDMVQRYSHLSADHLLAYVERGTKLTHESEQEKEGRQTAAVST